jgi:hypothetical protein
MSGRGGQAHDGGQHQASQRQHLVVHTGYSLLGAFQARGFEASRAFFSRGRFGGLLSVSWEGFPGFGGTVEFSYGRAGYRRRL